MLWIKAMHIIFLTTWFAGLFYLPRLFVYHAMTQDTVSHERFCVMERKLFWGIMTPGGILSLAFGLIMLEQYAWAAYKNSGWLHAKLLGVGGLVVYHVFCGKLVLDFKRQTNTRSHVWFRFFNEIPVLFLVAIVILVVVKPF
jgi:putative membrane protein